MIPQSSLLPQFGGGRQDDILKKANSKSGVVNRTIGKPEQKERPKRMGGLECRKKALNAKEAPSLGGDRLQPFDVAQGDTFA